MRRKKAAYLGVIGPLVILTHDLLAVSVSPYFLCTVIAKTDHTLQMSLYLGQDEQQAHLTSLAARKKFFHVFF